MQGSILHCRLHFGAGGSLICIFFVCKMESPAIRQIGFVKFITGDIWRPGNELFWYFPMIIGSIYVTAGAIIFGVPDRNLTSGIYGYVLPEENLQTVKSSN